MYTVLIHPETLQKIPLHSPEGIYLLKHFVTTVLQKGGDPSDTENTPYTPKKGQTTAQITTPTVQNTQITPTKVGTTTTSGSPVQLGENISVDSNNYPNILTIEGKFGAYTLTPNLILKPSQLLKPDSNIKWVKISKPGAYGGEIYEGTLRGDQSQKCIKKCLNNTRRISNSNNQQSVVAGSQPAPIDTRPIVNFKLIDLLKDACSLLKSLTNLGKKPKGSQSGGAGSDQIVHDNGKRQLFRSSEKTQKKIKYQGEAILRFEEPCSELASLDTVDHEIYLYGLASKLELGPHFYGYVKETKIENEIEIEKKCIIMEKMTSDLGKYCSALSTHDWKSQREFWELKADLKQKLSELYLKSVESGFVQLDMKPDNVLVNYDEKTLQIYKIRFTDFDPRFMLVLHPEGNFTSYCDRFSMFSLSCTPYNYYRNTFILVYKLVFGLYFAVKYGLYLYTPEEVEGLRFLCEVDTGISNFLKIICSSRNETTKRRACPVMSTIEKYIIERLLHKVEAIPGTRDGSKAMTEEEQNFNNELQKLKLKYPKKP